MGQSVDIREWITKIVQVWSQPIPFNMAEELFLEFSRETELIRNIRLYRKRDLKVNGQLWKLSSPVIYKVSQQAGDPRGLMV